NSTRTVDNTCVCGDKRIQGKYCQHIICENNGVDTGTGVCDCMTSWFTGRFCEAYAVPFVYICSGIAILIIIIVIACALCRLRTYRKYTEQHRSTRQEQQGLVDDICRPTSLPTNGALMSVRSTMYTA